MSIDVCGGVRYTIDWDKVQGHYLPAVKAIIQA
jgi:hypothetical protein